MILFALSLGTVRWKFWIDISSPGTMEEKCSKVRIYRYVGARTKVAVLTLGLDDESVL